MSLEGSQQLHLQRQRRVANLVEKERPTGRALEEACPGRCGFRKILPDRFRKFLPV